MQREMGAYESTYVVASSSQEFRRISAQDILFRLESCSMS